MSAQLVLPADQAALRIYARGRAAHVQRLRTLVASVPASRLPAFGLGSSARDRFKLRRGAYAAVQYDKLSWPDQLIIMACAVQDAAVHEPLFSHVTAAAIWGLPMIGSRISLVEHSLPPDARGRTANVRRRRTALAATTNEVGDLQVTDLERTVVDHCRQAKLDSAVAVADHALHHQLTSRGALLVELERVPKGARGRRMAQLAIHLADGLAESPLESLSRVRMFQTGLPRPELQALFEDGNGFVGRTDFHWKQLGLIGECDGALKYRVPEGDSDLKARSVLQQEKSRELRLRQIAEVDDLARWGWDDALPAGRLHRVLAAYGLRTASDGGGWPVPDGPLPKRAFVI